MGDIAEVVVCSCLENHCPLFFFRFLVLFVLPRIHDMRRCSFVVNPKKRWSPLGNLIVVVISFGIIFDFWLYI